ncbi:MAG: hypothetical protein ACLQGP_34175 [Isosphaeraceae bacterium]
MDITNSHHFAVALVGTVALPSPYPAYGHASLMLTDWDGEAVIYVKLVQVVNQKRMITRFIKPADIRAIRSRPTGGAADPETWPILSPSATQKEIAAGEAALIAHAKKAGVKELEESWHPAVILYVHEAAPVLHRHEAGVTAAVSAESLDFLASPHIPCCG